MKIKHFKIIVFICTFVLLFSILAISSFASEFNGVLTANQVITLSEELNFEFTPADIDFSFSTIDDPSTVYNNMSYRYTGRSVLSYSNASTGEQVTVYDAGAGGWVSDSFRHLKILNQAVLTDSNLGFFSLNIVTETSNPGFYDAIYAIFVSAIYGDRPLTSSENISATLLATVSCVFVVALPLIVVFWLTKFVFSLGRNW